MTIFGLLSIKYTLMLGVINFEDVHDPEKNTLTRVCVVALSSVEPNVRSGTTRIIEMFM